MSACERFSSFKDRKYTVGGGGGHLPPYISVFMGLLYNLADPEFEYLPTD